jgi:hypothetical protein
VYLTLACWIEREQKFKRDSKILLTGIGNGPEQTYGNFNGMRSGFGLELVVAGLNEEELAWVPR